MDILSVSSGDNKVSWFENDGNGGFTELILSKFIFMPGIKLDISKMGIYNGRNRFLTSEITYPQIGNNLKISKINIILAYFVCEAIFRNISLFSRFRNF